MLQGRNVMNISSWFKERHSFIWIRYSVLYICDSLNQVFHVEEDKIDMFFSLSTRNAWRCLCFPWEWTTLYLKWLSASHSPWMMFGSRSHVFMGSQDETAMLAFHLSSDQDPTSSQVFLSFISPMSCCWGSCSLPQYSFLTLSIAAEAVVWITPDENMVADDFPEDTVSETDGY